MPIRLEVDDGRDVRSVRVSRADVTLGRARGVDVRIGGRGVSRRHARLRVVGDSVEVVDLSTREGVQVRGRRVPRAIVAPGESFDLGSTRITLVAVAEDPEPVARPAARSVAGKSAAPWTAAARAATTQTAAVRPAPGTPRLPASSRPPIHHRPAHEDFDELLYAAFRRTPWYLLSAVAHVALFVALTYVDLGLSPARRPADEVLVVVADGSTVDGLDERVDELVVDDIVEDMQRLVPDTPADPLEFQPVRLDEFEDAEPFDSPLLLDARTAAPFDVPDAGESSIGLTPTAALGARLDSNFGKGDAGTANSLAARALHASPFSRNLLAGLRLRTSRVNVRVLGGEYDHCEDVLTSLGLEHDVLLPEELDLARPGAEIRAIFYNCTSKPLSPRALDHLERFVHAGGYLFTTDWGLENVLEQRFAQYVRTLRTQGRVVMTQDEIISFRATAAHPLLRGLPTGDAKSRWWLEDSSLLIDVVDRRAVEVLIESEDLHARHGSRPVAVTFRHGRGRVVHVLGHFFQKEGNLRGTVAMQRILLNFLYQSLRGG